MQLLEREIEDFIYNGFLEGNKKITEVFPDHINIYRQFELKGYGVVDLLTIDDVYFVSGERVSELIIRINIYELKVGQLKYEHISQVYRYKTALYRICEKHSCSSNIKIIISPYLIVENIDVNSDMVSLLNWLRDLTIVTYKYDLDGISFEYGNSSWYSTKEDLHKAEQLLKNDIKTIIKSIIRENKEVQNTKDV